MPITSIDATDVNKLTSGQVIIELQSVVKELVDNALDANSKQIEIVFNNYGIKGIDVTDNGKGIDKSDYKALCLKHHTSKLESFEDLESVSTLGFRGEALASMCAVARVKINTCSDSTYPMAAQLEYDSMGKLLSEKLAVSGKKGTTVSIQDLFHGLPVRQKYFTKNAKKEYSKALSLLVGYLLIYTNVRFAIYHISGNTGKKSMVMGTQGQSASIYDTLVSVYGSNGAHGMIPVDIATDDIEARFNLGMTSVPVSLKFRLKGLVLDYSFGMGRGALDRQFFYINKRPVVHKKFTKILNEVYKAFNHTQLPVFVLDIEIDQTFVDINVTPDKRSVMIQNEDLLGEVLREEMTKFYDGMHNVVPKSDLGVVRLGASQTLDAFDLKRKANDDKQAENQGKKQKSMTLTQAFAIGTENALLQEREEEEEEAEAEDEEEEEEEHTKEVTDDVVGDEEGFDNSQTFARADVKEMESERELEGESDNESEQELQVDHLNDTQEEVSPEALEVIQNTQENSGLDDGLEEGLDDGRDVVDVNSENDEDAADDSFLLTEEAQLFVQQDTTFEEDNTDITSVQEILGTAKLPKTVLSPDESHGHGNGCTHSMHDETFEIEDSNEIDKTTAPAQSGSALGPADRPLTKPLNKPSANEPVKGITKVLKIDTSDLKLVFPSIKKEIKPEKQSLANVHDVREKLVIQKLDFPHMEVVGQFNLGFIVVKHDERLFIVDQHASDEIFNYERLHRLLQLRAQPLVISRVLELLPIDEMLVLDQQEQLRKNGFVVREAEDPQPGKRVELVALPVLKNVVFDETDLHELVQRLHDVGPTQGSIVRCHKVDLMIALRACRLSIMVGQALNRSTMGTVVGHLAGLDKPWNCPHGRPTMRHLADLEGSGFLEDYQL